MTMASGLRRCDLNDLYKAVDRPSSGRRIEVESYLAHYSLAGRRRCSTRRPEVEKPFSWVDELRESAGQVPPRRPIVDEYSLATCQNCTHFLPFVMNE